MFKRAPSTERISTTREMGPPRHDAVYFAFEGFREVYDGRLPFCIFWSWKIGMDDRGGGI